MSTGTNIIVHIILCIAPYYACYSNNNCLAESNLSMVY